MNPKHQLIEVVFGPIAAFFESIYVTKWIIAVLFNGLIAYFIFRKRKRGDRINAMEVIIALAVIFGLGYAIYDQFLIFQALLKN